MVAVVAIGTLFYFISVHLYLFYKLGVNFPPEQVEKMNFKYIDFF